MLRTSAVKFGFGALILAVAQIGSAGCGDSLRVVSTKEGTESIAAGDVLNRCLDVYSRMRRYQARGYLKREQGRQEDSRLISWDFSLPHRCRLQIDMDVLIVDGGYWSIYRHAAGEFERRRQFDHTPLETSAFLMSGGVSFLLPAVFERGRRALGWSAARGYDDWRLTGIEWCADHPCYLLSRPAIPALGLPDFRLWIDQENHLIRGWAAIERGSGGGMGSRISCTYYDIKVNPRIRSSRFELRPPEPIQLRRPPAAQPDGASKVNERSP